MNTQKRGFTGCPMRWTRVLLLALLCAVFSAAVCLIPALQKTSLHDIAVYPDFWILAAVFIVVNCGKCGEAAVKCFVFFLVSQPLIYLFQVPFSTQGWGLFRYYDRWFVATLLTLPGAAVAYQVKRKTWLSAAVLSVAAGYLGWQAAVYFRMTAADFPHHLLSAVFCLTLSAFFAFTLLEKKSHRIAVLLVTAALFALSLASALLPQGAGRAEIYFGESGWECALEDASVLDVSADGDGRAVLTGRKNGSTILDFTFPDGRTESYCVVVDGKSVTVSQID